MRLMEQIINKVQFYKSRRDYAKEMLSLSP